MEYNKEYNKALSKYQEVVNKLDEQIQERESIIESGKAKIKDIKEKRKNEIKSGLFSNTLKKFSKTKDLSDIATDIEVATVELEALKELRDGDDDNLIKAAKDLVKAANEEADRLRDVRKQKEEAIEELKKKLNEMKDEIYGVNDGSSAVLSNTAYIISDILKAKYPEEFERYYSKGFIVTLMNRLIE